MLDKTRKPVFPNWEQKTFFRKMSHSVKKSKRGTLWDLIQHILLQNIKILEGDPMETFKKFRKKFTECRKKLKGGTL